MSKQRILIGVLTCLSVTLSGVAIAAPSGTLKVVGQKGLFMKSKPAKTKTGTKGKEDEKGSDKETDKNSEPEKSEAKSDKSESKSDKLESEPEKSDSKADKGQSKSDKKAGQTEGKGPAAREDQAKSSGGEAESKEAGTQPQAAEVVPPLDPDSALISVLKDLSRALKDSEEVAKIEDPCQKAAVQTATVALEKALSNPDLPSNRIITAKDKPRFESSMTAEAWDSGDIKVSPYCHASLNAVWAKKVGGLVNLSVAGNCQCKDSPDGSKLGEFVFVLSGKSAVDAGFDIQSQGNVDFWLGKMSGFTVDTNCCSGPTADAGTVKSSAQKSTLVLKALLTERGRQHLELVAESNQRQRLIALKAEAERKQAEEKSRAEAEAKQKAEAEAKSKEEGDGKAGALAAEKDASKAGAAAAERDSAKAGAVAGGKGGTTDTTAGAGRAAGSTVTAVEFVPAQAKVEDPRTQAASNEDARAGWSGSLAMGNPTPAPAAGRAGATTRGWDSPPASPASRMPSSSAAVLLPDKAVAGQFLTAAVLNPNHAGEPLVELSFNGATLATAQDGKALYMVPDDASPGPSLHVAIAARPESPAAPIHVLQPLAVPSGPQIPRIDRVTSLVESGGTLVIDGHSFDGVADRNRVIIDGAFDGRVLVSSPVQLKSDLPSNLAPGPHSVSVSTAGLRSNPGQFDVVTLEVRAMSKESGKEQLNKISITAAGTMQPVRVHIRNYTPDIIKIVKGNDIILTTPGGATNSIVLAVQRLQKGNYHIQAKLD